MNKDKKYVEYIVSLPCLVTGNFEVIPHHVRLPGFCGMGQKPADHFCVPLTQELHQKLHQMGEMAFWEKCNIDIKVALVRYLTRFIQEF